jgi:transcriptional regulator with XRE-family HTH domain
VSAANRPTDPSSLPPKRIRIHQATPARNPMQFSQKVRWLREREGMSQLELANQLSARSTKIWQNRMSQLENPPKRGREVKVEPGLLMRIAEFFSVPVGWLIDPRLGLDALHEPPGEFEALTEVERQVLLNVRILGPHVALARLLGVPPGTVDTAVASHAPAPTLKDDEIPKKQPQPPADGGSSPDPPDKKPRCPKARVGTAMAAKTTSTPSTRIASLGRMARTKKKSPGTPK